jgi:hypothetical protein
MKSPNEQELLDFLRLLEQYSAGIVNKETSGNSGAGTSSQSESSAPSSGNLSQGLGMSAAVTNIAAAGFQDTSLGQMAGLLGLGSALSNPNATLGSVAPSALGVAGFGQLASLASIAQNGFTTSNVLGILGSTVNPAFGLIGMVNGLTGNSIGNSIESIGNTLGNPNSMDSLSNIGIGWGDQIGNALNNSQVGMDTAGMDSLMGSFSDSSDSDSDSDSDSGSEGSDASSNQG